MAVYYQRLNAPRGLAQGYVELLDVIDLYYAHAARVKILPGAGRAVALAQRASYIARAEQVRKLLNAMWADYDQLEIHGALRSEQMIRQRIRQTASGRPAASGRLEKGIRSRPLKEALPVGAIGVADIDVLDATVINPRYKRYGPYWRAQEYGLPALTPADYGGGGRKVAPGYFMPGGARPDAGQFRKHPYFEQRPYSKGMPALMRLRPVPARYFLRDGTDAFIVWRQQQISRISRHAVSTMANIARM